MTSFETLIFINYGKNQNQIKLSSVCKKTAFFLKHELFTVVQSNLSVCQILLSMHVFAEDNAETIIRVPRDLQENSAIIAWIILYYIIFDVCVLYTTFL